MKREFTEGNRGTSVVRLQNYDNFDSLRDRLDQLSQSPDSPKRVILVWAPRGGVLFREVEFARLRSRLSRQGVECVIVSSNEQIRSFAKRACIPLADSVQEAELWNLPEKKSYKRKESPEQRAALIGELRHCMELSARERFSKRFYLCLLALLLLIFTAAFFLFVPRAEVVIRPSYTTQRMDLTLWTADGVEKTGLNGSLPSEIKPFSMEFSASVPSTGVVKGNAGIAVGSVKVTNRCDTVKSEAKGASIMSSDAGAPNFVSLAPLRLDAGESAALRVQASESGTSGNVAKGTPFTFSGVNGSCFEISAEEDFSGGTDGFYAAPCEADRAQAEAEIRKQVRGAVSEALGARYGDDLLMIEMPKILQISSEQMIPEFGYQSETFTLRQKLEISARVIRRDEMDELIRQMMDLEENVRGGGKISYQIITAPHTAQDRIIWELSAERQVYYEETNEEAARLMLKGKPLATAYQILREMSGEASFEIHLTPQEFPFLPLRGEAIYLRFEPADAGSD